MCRTFAVSVLVLAINGIAGSRSAEVPAFPGAEGYGAVSKGGRNGRIIAVTNLNDAGRGSLRAACESSGPRIVVFRVGGIIELDSEIVIRDSCITIAGQTAPGGGILLCMSKFKKIEGHNKLIRIKTHHVIIRYLRLRFGYMPFLRYPRSSNFFIDEGSAGVVLDHNSISWASDENLTVCSDSGSIRDITISWCIIGEGLRPDAPCSNNHGAGILCSSVHNSDAAVNFSLHHNLMIHNQYRNPLLAIKNAEVVNNITYNWECWAMMFCRGMRIDITGNIFRKGPYSGFCSGWVSRIPIIWRSDAKIGPTSLEPSIYISGNLGYGIHSSGEDNWKLIDEAITEDQPHPLHPQKSLGRPPDIAFRRRSPMADIPYKVTVHTAAVLPRKLLHSAGAYRHLNEKGEWVINRDSVDRRYIREYYDGTGKLPKTEDFVGGYPRIRAYDTPYSDSDYDGMPDKWEMKNGLDPENAADANQDMDGDGFTNIEEFLEGLPAKGPPVK